jgi:hypothetical protein
VDDAVTRAQVVTTRTNDRVAARVSRCYECARWIVSLIVAIFLCVSATGLQTRWPFPFCGVPAIAGKTGLLGKVFENSNGS